MELIKDEPINFLFSVDYKGSLKIINQNIYTNNNRLNFSKMVQFQ